MAKGNPEKAMSFGMHVIRQILFLFNFFTFFVGILIAALGISILVTMKDVAKLSPIVLYSLGGLVIVIGLGLNVMGFLGCCGSIRQSVKMLNYFFYYILVLLVIEIAAVVLGFIYKDELSIQLQNAWIELSKNLEPANVGLLTAIQRDYYCCGGSGPNDWILTFSNLGTTFSEPYGSNWNDEYPINSDTYFSPTCCDQNYIAHGYSTAKTCIQSLDTINTIGCVTAFSNAIEGNLTMISIILSVIGGLQIAALVASYLLTRTLAKYYGTN